MYEPFMELGAGGAVGGFAAVVIGMDAMMDQAIGAIRLAGGRVAAQLDWAVAASQVGQQATSAVLVIEAEGVDEGTLLATLPRIDAVASALDLPLVVALDERSIDAVAAAMLGPDVQLLCAPTMAERVGAIALAAGMLDRASLFDGLREGEAARLRRLNQEVARIADVLARLTLRESRDLPDREVDDRRDDFGQDAGEGEVVIEAGEVRRIIRARRLRDGFFGAGLLEDPAWDMLLDLFAAELEQTQVSVSSLCIAAAVAPTTALRWIGKLSDAGLFERRPDPLDRRRAFMALTERASNGMRNYMAAVHRAGLTAA